MESLKKLNENLENIKRSPKFTKEEMQTGIKKVRCNILKNAAKITGSHTSHSGVINYRALLTSSHITAKYSGPQSFVKK
jgi:hypothetical protein